MVAVPVTVPRLVAFGAVVMAPMPMTGLAGGFSGTIRLDRPRALGRLLRLRRRCRTCRIGCHCAAFVAAVEALAAVGRGGGAGRQDQGCGDGEDVFHAVFL